MHLAATGAPWVSRVRPGKPRHTLGTFCISKAHLGRFFLFQGAPWHIKAHLGTSRCALGFQGAPWKANEYFGRILHYQGAPWAIFLFPRCTLAPFCVSKVHLGRILYFQGAPWHIKAHLGTSRRTFAHQGAPDEVGNVKVDLGKLVWTPSAPEGEKLNHW